jgi:hypothetical protein
LKVFSQDPENMSKGAASVRVRRCKVDVKCKRGGEEFLEKGISPMEDRKPYDPGRAQGRKGRKQAIGFLGFRLNEL